MTATEPGPDEAAIPAARTAIAVTVAMILCFVAVTFGSILSTQSEHLGWYAATLAALAVIQIRHLRGGLGGRRPRYWIATTVLQVVLIYPPFLAAGISWVATPAFLGATLLLFLRSRWRWVLWGAVVAGEAAIVRALDPDLVDCAYYTAGLVFASICIYGLTRLADLIVELRAARAELVRLAAAGERDRVGRDLHDLLGYSLTAVVLKGELADRLAGGDLPRAAAELAGLVDVARQARSDVRTIATTQRRMSLDDELAAARSVLVSVGVATEVSGPDDALDAGTQTVLATVLREAVANLLRHSQATTCTIRVRIRPDGVALRVRNDGVPAVPAGSPGTGLDNLARRLGEAGGRVETDTATAGWFELIARLPASEPA
ncbi:sensor histidine kinase [Hamadaea tsunoensis]|uniref:sensor histidine kinase n=1 Tax=Hamadaea tsunoensis TaxID=53368 RepID=UPI00041FD23E|nr:histidine kinase [Hamadaea tsunoensis]